MIHLFLLFALAANAEVFVAKPYLQMGDYPKSQKTEKLMLLWHTETAGGKWAVEVRTASKPKWSLQPKPSARRIEVKGIEPHRVFTSTLSGFGPGQEFDYRVMKDGAEVFASKAMGRKNGTQPHRFAVFGDCGAGTPGQAATAYRLHQAKPDFVFTTGDIVYSTGRISEYRAKFFPVYNADAASPEAGAPLTRSTLFVAAPGNHDLANRDLAQFPDRMAYFYYWNQPLNGLRAEPGAPNTPVVTGSEESVKEFLHTAGNAYPRMANFSFDYGNAHWTVLDSNRYMDWNNPELQAWLIDDLKSARGAVWRFVAFHHPGFHSSKVHANDQWMRVLAPVFEKYGVDVVFGGHVHNYQRSLPLHFKPKTAMAANGAVDGEFALDKAYDGASNTRPRGVIYIVTGAGGARLYDPPQEFDRESWQPYTEKFFSNRHSITIADVEGPKLSIRQVADDGSELDRFTITR